MWQDLAHTKNIGVIYTAYTKWKDFMTENTSSDAKAASFLLETYYYYAGQCLTAINRIRNDTKIVYIICVCTVYIYYVNIKRDT